MVVFDTTLDTFRFAHLSVREFLENQPEYTTSTTNAVAAAACLLNVLSAAQIPATKRFLDKYVRGSTNSLFITQMSSYSTFYWAPHCQLAKEKMASGVLQDFFHQFLSYETNPKSALMAWVGRIDEWLHRDYWNGLTQVPALRDIFADKCITLFIVAGFDLFEPASVLEKFRNELRNKNGKSVLEAAAKYGSCSLISILIQDNNTEIRQKMIKAAAGN